MKFFKTKRNAIKTTVDEDFSKVVVPKSPEEEAHLRTILQENYMFEGLEASQLTKVIEVMKPIAYAEGQDVIVEGGEGKMLYVMTKGHCQAIVGGKVVAEYAGTGIFGELALIYNAPRAATVRATMLSELYSLDVNSFRHVLSEQASARENEYRECLLKVPLLKTLDAKKLTTLVKSLEKVKFLEGETIITQGAAGDAFYVIEDGEVTVTRRKDDATLEELAVLKAPDYFGEMALLDNSPRHATVVAKSPVVVCLTLSRAMFTKLLGPLKSLLQAHACFHVLRSIDLFKPLTDAECDSLVSAMETEKFKAGATIFKEGKKGTKFYVIQTGSAKIERDGQALGVLGTNDYFGEAALINHTPHVATIAAVDDVACYTLDRKKFEKLLMHTAGTAEKFEKEMKRREALMVAQTSGSGSGPPGSTDNNAPALKDLKYVRMLGQGTFGRVKLMVHHTNGDVYTLKCMSKSQIIEQQQEKNVINERDLLFECSSTFVLTLFATYQSPDELMLLMELIQGGELWTYIYEKRDLLPRTRLGGFTDDTSRFYAGCVASALQYVHNKGVAYRDLKPENLLMDAQGFIKIIDFGFAKKIPYLKKGKQMVQTFTLCGTPEYIAPEILLSKGHDKAVDCWALGCLMYELLTGATPFCYDDQQQIFRAIVQVNKTLVFPKGFPAEAETLVRGMLVANPAKRLGNMKDGLNAVVNSGFFSTFDWEQLNSRALKPPYHPPVKDSKDASNIDQMEETGEKIPKFRGNQDVFKNF
ncbi:hypothetical protein CTAYLR_006818 [Chrysophaeum taylorii]|uniref:cGMP-dependent protein kinase n=1 Tax=Chrysophaeum taylorii TaxID=2483200 RepID=A0AAD7XJK5_9STRA|nr:hypothetical protein CTAYLR_006818 [Chrysophaeum taylorii]